MSARREKFMANITAYIWNHQNTRQILIIFFGTTYVKYKRMILLYVLGRRLQKKSTMFLPVSDQHAPVGRKNVLAPESATEFPHTVVSGVESCAIPRNWKRKENFPSGPFRPSVRPSVRPSHPVQRWHSDRSVITVTTDDDDDDDDDNYSDDHPIQVLLLMCWVKQVRTGKAPHIRANNEGQ
jgi:hypothetical protein